jgi:hypothetical protein
MNARKRMTKFTLPEKRESGRNIKRERERERKKKGKRLTFLKSSLEQ